MKNKIFFLIVCLFLVTTLVSSAQTTNIFSFDEGYTIVNNPQDILKQNQEYQINFFVYNSSNGVPMDNTSITCNVFVASNNGSVLFFAEADYFADGHWGEDIPGETFAEVGYYGYGISCQDGDLGGALSGLFQVTPTGSSSENNTSSIYITFLFILLIFFVMTLVSFTTFDNLLNKVSMIGIGYFLLIAITFIGFNMARDFTTTAPFIAEFLYLIWLLLMFLAFPLLLGAFAWYLLMLFRIKEINDLIEKGLPEYDAMARVKSRRKW